MVFTSEAGRRPAQWRRRTCRALAGTVLAMVPVVTTGLSSHALVSLDVPGGCVVINATALGPQSCEFVSLGSDPVEVAYVGTGSFSVVSTTGCANLITSSTNALTPAFPTGACGYSASTAGPGIVAVIDSNFSPACVDVDGLGPNNPCVYDNVGTTGTAVAEVIAAVPTTVTFTIYDVTGGFPGVAVATPSCVPGSGIGSITAECLFTEVPSHAYEATVAVSSAPVAGPLIFATG